MIETNNWLVYGLMWIVILSLLYFRHKVLDEQKTKD